MDCSTPCQPVPHHLPEFAQVTVNCTSIAIDPCHPLSSPSPPAPNPSHHQDLFQCVNSSHDVAKVLEFQPQHRSFKWTSRTGLLKDGLVGSLAVQGTHKSLLEHHSSKLSILQCSAFFTVQLSHPYTTTGKTIALTRWTIVGKIISLLFKMLSRLVMTFLQKSKRLVISWLQSTSAVILEPQKIKVWHCFHCFPIYFPWSDGTRCHVLRFLNVEL